jgi:hypothetical protein
MAGNKQTACVLFNLRNLSTIILFFSNIALKIFEILVQEALKTKNILCFQMMLSKFKIYFSIKRSLKMKLWPAVNCTQRCLFQHLYMKVNDGFDRANKIMYDLWKRAL